MTPLEIDEGDLNADNSIDDFEDVGLIRRESMPRAVRELIGEPNSGFSRWQHLCLGAYWMGWSFLWLPLTTVVIPSQVDMMAGNEGKGTALGSVLLYGAMSALLLAPTLGALSDSSRNKAGRRRPFMVVGVALATVALACMALSNSITTLSLSFLLLSVANNMIISPYSALVPDVVPAKQRGEASGWLGAMSMIGYLCGGWVTYRIDSLGIHGAYVVLIIVHAASMVVTVYFTKEPPLPEPPLPRLTCRERLRSFIDPFKDHDFRVVFCSRFLMQMGILTVQEYLQYYMQDAIHSYTWGGVSLAATPQKAVTIVFVPVLLGALLASIVAGIVSDRIGRRKPLVYASGGLMALACLMFGLTRSFALDLILALIFGLGLGVFSVVDWALATDVLPSPDEAAKDLGLWSLALVLPQVVAGPLAGTLLDYFQRHSPSDMNLGYTIIFMCAVVYYALGTYCVKMVRGVQ